MNIITFLLMNDACFIRVCILVVTALNIDQAKYGWTDGPGRTGDLRGILYSVLIIVRLSHSRIEKSTKIIVFIHFRS